MDFGILAAVLTLGIVWLASHCTRNGCGQTGDGGTPPNA